MDERIWKEIKNLHEEAMKELHEKWEPPEGDILIPDPRQSSFRSAVRTNAFALVTKLRHLEEDRQEPAEAPGSTTSSQEANNFRRQAFLVVLPVCLKRQQDLGNHDARLIANEAWIFSSEVVNWFYPEEKDTDE